MYNLLISLAGGTLVLLAIRFGTNVGWVGSVVPGLLVALITYFVLVRRSLKMLERVFEAAQKELAAQRFEKAIQELQAGFTLAPWQFMVSAQLHSQIGVLHFVRQNFDAALPHLEKSWERHWVARAMLAISRYRQRDLKRTVEVFEKAVRLSKKEGLLWSAYAFCLEKEGLHDQAISVMSRAAAANPSDEKVKGSLQALQNGKKLKLGKQYGEQWFQFHLERIPQGLIGPGGRGGRRVVFQRR